MAEHALYNAPPPPELTELGYVKRWGFPNAGGYLDQPHWMLPKLTTLDNVYTAMSSYRSAAGHTAEWATKNPALSNIVDSVLIMRMEYVSERQSKDNN